MFEFFLFVVIEIFLLFLVILVYVKNPKNDTNLFFSKVYVISALWAISNYLENEFIDISSASLFLRLDFAIAPFIFYYYLLFCLNFPKPIQITIQKKLKILIPMAILSLLSFSNLVIRDIKLTGQGIQFKESILFIPYTIVLFCYAVTGVSDLVLKTRKYTGIQRMQIYYVLLGVSIGPFIALIVNLVLTQLFTLSISISRIGIYALVFPAIFAAHAILKYRLMDIKIVLTRAGVFFFVYLLILGIPFGIGGFIKEHFSKVTSSWWVLPLLLMAFLASGGPFIYMRLQRRLEVRLRAQEFKSHEALRRLSHNMLRFTNLNVLLRLMVHYLVKVLKLRFAAIYLLDRQSEKYILSSAWHSGENIELPQEFEAGSYLAEYLLIEKLPIVTEELLLHAPATHTPKMKELTSTLLEFEINTTIPSFLRSGLIGFLILSDRRKKNMPFTQEDLNLLMVLSNEAALAIENAQFHQKEISTLVEKSKREALADMAPGASHQFNNRLASISSSVELLLLKLENFNIGAHQDEATKALLKDAKEALELIDNEVYKGKEITSAILKRAKAKVEFQEFNLSTLIENTYKLVMISRSRSGLDRAKELKFNIACSDKIPDIFASEALLQDVFYNLIDNAYDAIQDKAKIMSQEGNSLFQGEIEVALSREDNIIVAKVRDNGIGLTKENHRKLFTPYFTTKATSNKGSGLGLCVIRDFIEVHKGTITCDSEYNKGATFTIRLPIKKKAHGN